MICEEPDLTARTDQVMRTLIAEIDRIVVRYK